MSETEEEPILDGNRNDRTSRAMKRKNNADNDFDILKKHFKFDEKTKKINCTVTDCTGTVARWQNYFFKRHFEAKHPTLLRQFFPLLANQEQECRIEACKLIFNAVELVTINGYPFSILDSSAMRGLLSNQLHALETKGHKLSINRHTHTHYSFFVGILVLS